MSNMPNLDHSGTARMHASDLVRHARDNKRVARELDHLHLHDLANELRGFADNQLRMARMWLPRRRNGYSGGPWQLLRLMERHSRQTYRRPES
ncbi:hypothetical protein ACE0DR_04210 [Azotobacter sp. CWF10]